MESTNRRWQNHLRSKGVFAFFLDRLRAHAQASKFQHPNGAFYFEIKNRDQDDELTRAFYELSEEFPTEFYIETTNHCNLNCRMCARTAMTRPKGTMSFELLKKIVDEIAEELPHAYIHWYGIGDPLMDPEIAEKMGYARSKGITSSLFFTNGQLLLHDDNYKKIARSGVAHMGVDLDGFSPETYNQIRIGGEFEKAKEGIIKLHDYIRSNKLKTRVEIAYQVYPGINEREVQPFIEWCRSNDYEYKLVTMHTWAGLRNDLPRSEVGKLVDDHAGGERNCPCLHLWRLSIGWNGKVHLCFQDADCQECLGDLNKSSIKSIWQNAHFQKRRKHVQGIFDGLCTKCTSYTNVNSPRCFSPLYPEKLLEPRIAN